MNKWISHKVDMCQKALFLNLDQKMINLSFYDQNTNLAQMFNN